MNQQQREFLIKRVEKTFDKQKSELKNQLPEKPSLNNYLIASFLDNSIQFNDIEKLKVNMRSRVLKFGTSDKLITNEDRGYYRNRTEHTCEISAEDLFIIPEIYKETLAEYEKIKTEIDTKVTALEAQRDTILLKIQIGSNTVLDKLITQVDNLADLNIMNSQFLLEDPKS